MQPITILLDMDGVCCDFVSSALKAFNHNSLLREWPKGQYDIHTVLGVKENEFWSHIERKGSEFWEHMAPYPWFKVLYSSLKSLSDNVVFCSSPSQDPNSVHGKMKWLQNHFGVHFRDFMFIPKKEVLSRKGMLLIDDRDISCQKFNKKNGPAHEPGHAILFPAPWNTLHEKADPDGGMIAHVLVQVEKYIESLNPPKVAIRGV